MTKLDRRAVIASLGAAAVAPKSARAAWPERPINLLHGFAAGGNADVVGRIMAEALAPQIGSQLIVEAKPGAGGTLAASSIARAAPDGYTLGILPGGHAVSAALYKQLSFKPVEDFTWITMISDFPFLLTTYQAHPVHNIKELIEFARKAAEPPLWGSAGNGTGQHMAGELLASMANIKLKHVPYRGGVQGAVDVLAGRIDFMMDTATALLEHVKSGGLRAIAVTGSERFFALPDVPTVAEGGVPGYETTSWLGLAAPRGLDAGIVAQLNKTMAAVLAEPTTIERLKAVGAIAKPTSPAAFRDRVISDIAKWTKVVETAKLEKI